MTDIDKLVIREMAGKGLITPEIICLFWCERFSKHRIIYHPSKLFYQTLAADLHKLKRKK